MTSLQNGRRISALELEKASKLELARKTAASKKTDEASNSHKVDYADLISPRKKPKRKEKFNKTTSDPCVTPTKCRPSTLIKTPPKRKKHPQNLPETESRSPTSNDTDQDEILSPYLNGTSIGTQFGNSGTTSTSVGTQTLSPPDCSGSCKGCCRNFPPLYSGPKSRTPASGTAVGSSTCTPAAVRNDLTPKSCSNSSIPRPKRIHTQSDLATTPTKGHAHVLMHTSPENKENSEHRARRKFTKTGTPIHRYNCRCTFCVSSATDISELSNSPILDMPSRPRKRLLSHEYSAESNPKKRKSLFRSGSEVSSEHTLRSCSPDQENRAEEGKQDGEEPITVSRWLGGKIGSSTSRSQSPDLDGSGDEKLDVDSEEIREENGTVSRHDGHDHTQCSTLHCIRSYFMKK